MADEFFDDEEELMEAAEAPAAKPVATPRASRQAAAVSAGPAPAAETSGKRTPPPFWMVLAIAAIALLLGVVIGYLIGSSATLSAIESMQMITSSQDASSASDAGTSYELPEGHPDLDVDADGTAHVADGSSAE